LHCRDLIAIKYWEFEDAPLREKLKSPSIKEIAKIFYDNETEAYRFSLLLLEVKRKGELRLKDVPESIPIATAKRYLDFAMQIGMLKHENSAYSLTDRFSKPFRNMATYVKAWMDAQQDEDLSVQFANVKLEKQAKRGGKQVKSAGAGSPDQDTPVQNTPR
jgi:hypothetical protein